MRTRLSATAVALALGGCADLGALTEGETSTDGAVDASTSNDAPAASDAGTPTVGDSGAGTDAGADADASTGSTDANEPHDAPGAKDSTPPHEAGSDATTTTHSISLVNAQAPGLAYAATQSASSTFTAGNFLVAAVYWDLDTAMVTVSDTLGNKWKAVAAMSNANPCTTGDNGAHVQIWYAENIDGGAGTVTVTQSSATLPIGFYLLEYSGIAQSNSFDARGTGAPSNESDTLTIAPFSTTGALDLVVALFNDADNLVPLTAVGPFESEGVDPLAVSVVEDTPTGVPPGTYSPQAALPSGVDGGPTYCWVAIAAAFKAK